MFRPKWNIAEHRNIGREDKDAWPSCREDPFRSAIPTLRLSHEPFWSERLPNQKPLALHERHSTAFLRRVADAPPLPQAGGHPKSRRSLPAAHRGLHDRASRAHYARGNSGAPGPRCSSCRRERRETPRRISRWRIHQSASRREPPPEAQPASPTGCTRQGRMPRAWPSGSMPWRVPWGLR